MDKSWRCKPKEKGSLSADEEELLFLTDECDAFDSDVDVEPTAQSIFMANLSSAGPTNIQASSSNASILSKVPDLKNANVASNNDQAEHEIHSEVQHCASSAPNTAYVLIDNNVHTPNEPLVTELAIYKEQVAIYEQRAKFELTEREQRMDDQMRILIQDRNRMEEKLKQELHSVKLQLNHSIKSQTPYCAHNPCHLERDQVAQPTLYDGNEIINPDHDPTNVPSSEEDLELAELARQKMHEKMNDPVCVEKRIKFSDMHDAFTIAHKRIADLESENFNLRNKIQNDDHDSMIKHFSKHKVEHFKLQLKYQNLKERNTIHELKEKNSRLTEKNSDADPILDLKALVSQNKDLTAKLNALHDLNERLCGTNLPDNKISEEVQSTLYQTLKEIVETLREIPTGRLLPLGRQCPLVRSTALKSDCMPADPQETIAPVVQIVLWYLDSGCSKHMTRDRSWLRNFMKKFIGTVRFRNDHFDLEVAFRKHTCFVRNLDGVDLIKGSHGTNLYTISIDDMIRSSLICLLSKASKNKSWLWHRRLNHLNFGKLNDLARKDLVRGLPRLKFEEYHLCSVCQLGKSRKASHKPKMINTITKVLHTLHMDLCGPMRVQSINRKKYILVIVDDYSRFTWVKFLRSKDETLAFVINLLKQLQVGLNKTVRF
ncbi:retrovirus-related pol polyprotein from transposon TNT 1-94 [Tanacetum coccineum]|uniref:Retrovirus-related pol polyprotein from transposon TNT 1-94 n=1 Tax=Tanacetum coccineum TaxID=301880 RepID=A0ABQ5AQE4_9ASTR